MKAVIKIEFSEKEEMEEASALIEQGIHLYSNGKYQDAVDKYCKAIELNSNLNEQALDHHKLFFLFGQAEVLYNNDQFQEAIAQYDEVIKLNLTLNEKQFYYTSKARVLHKQGKQLCEEGKYEHAIIKYDEAIELTPDDAVFYNGKACVLFNQADVLYKNNRRKMALDKLRETIVHHDKAIELKPDDTIFYRDKAYVLFKQGEILCEKKSFKEALTKFDEAIKFKSDDGIFYNKKASILTRQGCDLIRKRKYEDGDAKFKEAIVQYDEAIKLDPDNVVFFDDKITGIDIQKKELLNYGQFSESVIEKISEAEKFTGRGRDRSRGGGKAPLHDKEIKTSNINRYRKDLLDGKHKKVTKKKRNNVLPDVRKRKQVIKHSDESPESIKTTIESYIKNDMKVGYQYPSQLIKSKLYHGDINSSLINEEYSICASDKKIIGEICNLISQGNDKIQDNTEKAILILGKTGVGKSTLTYLLAKQQLKAKFDDNTGSRIIESVKQLDNIKISHKIVSETKIPNKYQTDDVGLWDCPGFNDTGGIAQEIANAFYIRRLFEITKELKFILVVPDASMSNRSEDIVSIVDHFVRLFKDIACLTNSVSLVITQALSQKKIFHIENFIKNIIEQNHLITNDTKQMLQFLLKSVHIFYQPAEDGIVKQDQDILKAINSSTKYVKVSADLANIAISKKSIEYAEVLFDSSDYTLSDLVKIITEAVKNQANKYVDPKNYTNDNIFVKNFHIRKELFTIKKPDYPKSSFIPNQPKYFSDLNQIFDFQEIFEKFLEGNQNSNFDSFRHNIVKILKIFQHFSSNNEEDQIIQIYSHLLIQQIECLKFLKDICPSKQIDLIKFSYSFQESKSLIDKASINSVKSMTLEKNKDDIDYYNKAIYYLDKYSAKNSNEYKKKLVSNVGFPQSFYRNNEDIHNNTNNYDRTKGEAYYYIGRIYDKKTSFNKAVFYYIEAIKIDKSLNRAYERIGDLLVNKKQYSDAIKCFKVINNSIKVLNCFKEIIKQNPEDAKIRLEKGHYFVSICRIDKAVGCYDNAFSLSRDANFRSDVMQKKAKVLKQQQELTKVFCTRISNKDFYNYNEINPEKFYNDIVRYFSNISQTEIDLADEI